MIRRSSSRVPVSGRRDTAASKVSRYWERKPASTWPPAIDLECFAQTPGQPFGPLLAQ